MRPVPTLNTNTSFNATATHVQHSPWHSPVPYLFGGLAAMMGLIAFALLILACSYWKITGFLGSSRRRDGESDLQNPHPNHHQDDPLKPLPITHQQMMEMKVVVIMAGDHKPTYLATPISKKEASCFPSDDDCRDGEKDSQKQNGGDQATHDQRSGDDQATNDQGSGDQAIHDHGSGVHGAL